MDLTLYPSTVSGTVTVPSSKSHTIRALLIAAFAQGRSVIHNFLDSADTQSCIAACRTFGASIEKQGTALVVESDSIIRSSSLHIDCGNSGTTLYLATGLAASLGIPVFFSGDAQLRRRPAGNLLDSLTDLGAVIEPKGTQYPPFSITGPLRGGSTSISCPTSQYLSALLLGCPLATGDSSITVPLLSERPYVQMTQSWLDMQGISYRSSPGLDHFFIAGNQQYHPFEATVPGDYSSASFFFCAPAVAGGSVTVSGLDPADVQGDKEVLSILTAMGCHIAWTAQNAVTVSSPGPGRLISGSFDLNAIPDALPILAVTACFAEGTTILGNVCQARIKETDRIAVMCKNLSALGADIEEQEDGLVIRGTGRLEGGTCEGYDDHRVIMAMAIASLGCAKPVTIAGIDAVNVTFPTFFTLLESITIEKQGIRTP